MSVMSLQSLLLLIKCRFFKLNIKYANENEFVYSRALFHAVAHGGRRLRDGHRRWDPHGSLYGEFEGDAMGR